jgi:CheY-like chemotaxis protein
MNKKTVLVVDDEKNLLLVLERALMSAGYFVLTADNGPNAIQLVRSRKPDLIILDVSMPTMDGGQVAAILKEDPATAKIPIFFLTALVSKNQQHQPGDIIGGNIFIAKPYDMGDLLARVDTVLQLPREVTACAALP